MHVERHKKINEPQIILHANRDIIWRRSKKLDCYNLKINSKSIL